MNQEAVINIKHSQPINYVKVTGTNIIKKVDEIPSIISINGHLTELPKSIRAKQDFMRVGPDGRPIECSHIHPSLGYLLNALSLEGELRHNELDRALESLYKEVAKLIKQNLLKGKMKRGAMSFSQASESVPKNSIVISKESYELLCADNSKWKETSHVFCTRFPNLGPRTTIVLRLIVDEDPISSSFTISDSMAGATLRQLADQLEKSDHFSNITSTFGCFWLNGSNLKNDLEGDGDGDILYIAPLKKGKPKFKKVDWSIKPGDVDEDDVATLFRKGSRIEREDASSYIPQYFDAPLIGPATYGIRVRLFLESLRYSNEDQPMHLAWKNIGDWAIELIETVMDVRKGDMSQAYIQEKFREIERLSLLIKKRQEAGCWFCKTVTSREIIDVDKFVATFETLEKYTEMISGKTSN